MRVETRASTSYDAHPLRAFFDRGMNVALNTDNRLMSGTTMSQEFEAAADTFGLTLDDFEKITINSMKSAFLPYKARCDLIYSAIKPGYARVRDLIRDLSGAKASI